MLLQKIDRVFILKVVALKLYSSLNLALSRFTNSFPTTLTEFEPFPLDQPCIEPMHKDKRCTA